MHYSSKTLLDSDELSKYNLPVNTTAFIMQFDHIIEERSYDIENELIGEGYKIHFEQLDQVSVNVFNYIVVVSKN